MLPSANYGTQNIVFYINKIHTSLRNTKGENYDSITMLFDANKGTFIQEAIYTLPPMRDMVAAGNNINHRQVLHFIHRRYKHG